EADTGKANVPPFHLCCAFSPNGDHFALAWAPWDGRSTTSYVTLFTWPEGKACQRLGGFKVQPEELTFTPDGTELLVADEENGIQVFDLASGKARWKIHKPSEQEGVLGWRLACALDGNLLACARMGRLQLWDYPRRQLLVEHELPAEVDCFRAAFTRDGQRLVLGLDRRVHIYRVSDLLTSKK